MTYPTPLPRTDGTQTGLASGALYADTPTVAVTDNRGQAVRTLHYNRTDPREDPVTYLSKRSYTPAGYTLSDADPRLQAASLTNFGYTSSLSGQSLRTDSVDAGTQAVFYDIEGHPIWSRDARGTVTRRTYDMLGRPTQVSEQRLDDETQQPLPTRVRERLIYGDNAGLPLDQTQEANVRGVLVTHWDPAGVIQVPTLTVSGQPQVQCRQLLEAVDGEGDWSSDNDADWRAQLATAIYDTTWTYNALGAALSQTDAQRNTQTSTYNVAGQLQSSTLTLAGSIAQPVLRAIRYSAAGQVLEETAGNGVVTQYDYEPQTQRLRTLTTVRPVQDVRRQWLQNLHYTYDPVGNITAIDDMTQPDTFISNQRVSAANRYQYDALYQLIAASGRETANAAQQGLALPDPVVPLITDATQLVNYQRAYTYDMGSNLTRIRHHGAQSYTHDIVVSNASNRAVQQNANQTLTPESIDAQPWFDRAGNSLRLQPDQPQALQWNGRNQLGAVVQIARSTVPTSDRELYQYDGSGMRVRKTTISYANGGQTQQTQTVIYLPGLELRTTASGTVMTEDLHVLTTANTGRAQVCVLHWATGIPDDIPNDQIRYSLGNQIGSVMLELDSAANILTWEEYYPYGGTSVWSGKSQSEAKYKFIRYSSKERDATGLYYYGYRYYMPWLGRWLNPDPAGTVDGLNLFRMVRNNPIRFADGAGLAPEIGQYKINFGIRDKLRLKTAASAIKIQAFDEKKDKFVNSNKFKLVEVNDGGGFALGGEEFKSQLGSYRQSYEGYLLSPNMENNMSENIELGRDVSGWMLDSAEDAMPREQYHDCNFNPHPDVTYNSHFFAIMKKDDEYKLPEERHIYGMAELKAGTETKTNKTTVTFNYALAHPETQMHHAAYRDAHASEINDHAENKEFHIKGVGTYIAIKSINRLSKKYNIESIEMDAQNIRSAVIAKKFGAKFIPKDQLNG